MKKQYLIPQVDTIVLAKPLCDHISGGSGTGVIPPLDPAPVRGTPGKLYI
ncbi:MAG: hypothetical protein KBS69_04035 [Bacteroidales bacterium]|nr:hypothetical protein [Candidatus Colicola caccequi]